MATSFFVHCEISFRFGFVSIEQNICDSFFLVSLVFLICRAHTHREREQLIASLSTTMQLTEVLKWTFRMRLLFVFVTKYLLCIDKSNGGCVTLSNLWMSRQTEWKIDNRLLNRGGVESWNATIRFVPKSKKTSRNKINRVNSLRLSYYLSWNCMRLALL